MQAGAPETTLSWDYTLLDAAGVSYVTMAARMGWWDLVRSLVDTAAKKLGPGPDGGANPELPKLLNARSKDGETALGWVVSARAPLLFLWLLAQPGACAGRDARRTMLLRSTHTRSSSTPSPATWRAARCAAPPARAWQHPFG